ncbi:MAG: Fic family protein [Christensenellales bacterium]|jgi:ATP-dependent DNA helicase RecG
MCYIKLYDSSLWATPQATPQATPHAEQILTFCMTARTRNEIAEYFGVKDPKFFAKKHIKPLLESGALRMTMPNKPTSPAQKYVTVKKNKM